MKVTKSSFEKMKKKLEYEEGRLETLQTNVREAVNDGDGEHDNPVWQRASEELASCIKTISSLKRKIKEAEVVGEGQGFLGKKVVLIEKNSKRERVFEIVSSEFAKPPSEISIDSPIVQKIIQTKVGEEFEVNTPLRTMTYILKSVS